MCEFSKDLGFVIAMGIVCLFLLIMFLVDKFTENKPGAFQKLDIEHHKRMERVRKNSPYQRRKGDA